MWVTQSAPPGPPAALPLLELHRQGEKKGFSCSCCQHHSGCRFGQWRRERAPWESGWPQSPRPAATQGQTRVLLLRIQGSGRGGKAGKRISGWLAGQSVHSVAVQHAVSARSPSCPCSALWLGLWMGSRQVEIIRHSLASASSSRANRPFSEMDTLLGGLEAGSCSLSRDPTEQASSSASCRGVKCGV
jgi:hypothetical protein